MKNQALQVGDKAPAFKCIDQNHKTRSLSEFKGKHLVLYFYPKDMTSGCTQEACDFSEVFLGFKKKKVIILGVSKDSAERHQKFIQKYNLPFDLLADEDVTLCKAYGVYKEKSLYGRKFMGIERTTFIIGPTGRIEAIFEKVKVNGHVKEVTQALKG